MPSSHLPGIYVHIPFCEKRCEYCDFFSLVSPENIPVFMQSLRKEIDLRSKAIDAGIQFDSLYIGGGTPSLLSSAELEKLFRDMTACFSLTGNAEITIEVNPESISREKLNTMRQLGVNRISIGIQSFLDHELQYLGRIHTAEQSEIAYKKARNAGFDNISIDLIFALPDQNPDEWRYSLDRAAELHPEHISAYSLIFEDGTPFGERLLTNKVRARSADEEYEFFTTTIEILERNGYGHYEISNYAVTDEHQSRHNKKYWNHTAYLGFGPSAHSFWERERWSNHRSLSRYLKSLDQNVPPIDFRERLDDETLKFECIFLSLRTTRGINLSAYEHEHHGSFQTEYRELIRDLTHEGLAVLDENHFRLTRKGLCLCDEILPHFMPV
jgi:oxygen-independent coproporphyrinogen-3 oxidase